ncbi:hypothetical protein [Nocardioides sp. SR21]|uniref:hypothetical protein n=1 Tax=Nocardioides sp. SR21 TaxID=2919501 RepID=UPI001FA9F108|nr:hypothetical protein [Nocardioides sp. SR21]
MKIRTERKALADTIQWVAQAIPKKPQAPALSGIRITAADGALTLAAFDYDAGHTATIPAEVLTEGDVLVSGRYLLMIASGLRGDEAELVLDGQLTIKSGRSTYRMQPMQLDEFPTLPTFSGRVGVIDADALTRIVGVATGPVDDDAVYEETRGIHLEASEHAGSNALWAVGIDGGARSIHAAASTWSQDAALSIDLPSSSLTAAVKGMTGAVEIGHTDGTLSLRDNARTVTLRSYALAKSRSNWRTIMDRAADGTVASVTTTAKDLRTALTRAAAFGDDGRESYVGLIVEPDSISVRAHGAEDVVLGEDVLEGEMESEETVWFGINAGLLGLALGALGDAQVGIGFATTGCLPSGKPLYIWPIDRDDVQILVLPRTWMGETPA